MSAKIDTYCHNTEMICNCGYCNHFEDCEYKENYRQMVGKIIESIHELDKQPEYHCYFSYSICCDYFYPKQPERKTKEGIPEDGT